VVAFPTILALFARDLELKESGKSTSLSEEPSSMLDESSDLAQLVIT
jgi:hypothetical protein